MSAQLSANTHQAYGFAYDQLVAGWGVPPNPTPTDQLLDRARQLHDEPNRNDCLALVNLIQTAAKLFPNVISATNALGVVLAGADFYQLALRNRAGHNVQPQVSFGNNGFRTELAGVPGDNQVRHFTGGLLVGAALVHQRCRFDG